MDPDTEPDPGGPTRDNVLTGVAAVSAANVWAVGYYSSGDTVLTLTEHWNGSTWTVVPSPDPSLPGLENRLQGVAALSARNIWAVGTDANGSKTLILHWNGTRWKHVPSPSPGHPFLGDTLNGVAVVSRTSAWAVGEHFTSTGNQVLIEHWNGTTWNQARTPDLGSDLNLLLAVSAASGTSAWAAGVSSNTSGATATTLVLHWNGRAWKRARTPDTGTPGTLNFLYSVAATSPASAWAAGTSLPAGRGPETAIVLHWNGRTWERVRIPNPGNALLTGVAASSARNVWAVGDDLTGTGDQAIALHCC